MILAGWDNPDFLKNKVFQNQIGIIDSAGLLKEVIEYLMFAKDYDLHKSAAKAYPLDAGIATSCRALI